MEQLSLCARTTDTHKPRTLFHNKRDHLNEKLETREWAPLATTRESLCTATKTNCSQKKKKKRTAWPCLEFLSSLSSLPLELNGAALLGYRDPASVCTSVHSHVHLSLPCPFSRDRFCRCLHTSCSITTFSASRFHDSPTAFSQFTLINPVEVFLPLRNFSWQSFSIVNYSFLLVLFLVHTFTIACVTLHCIYLFRCLSLLPGNESLGQEWTSLPSWFQYPASFCYVHTLNICLLRDFPVGPVAMTPCSFPWRGPGFKPWSGI